MVEIKPSGTQLLHNQELGQQFLKPMEPSLQNPPNTSQPQRKLRPSNFKKLVEKLDMMKNPHNHRANIKQVIRAKQVNEWHMQFEGFG